MTPEEACEYLDISMDDDLDLAVLEKNYKAKLAVFGDSQVNRAKINEAYNILHELYDELYASENHRSNEGILMKFAVLLAGMFLLCFGGVMYFVYKIHTDSIPPKNESVQNRDYERLLRELEGLRMQQAEAQRKQKEAHQAATQNVSTPPADYAALVERVMPSMVFIQTSEGKGSGFFVSPNGDILTNYHVIEDADFIIVSTNDGRSINALVKDYDSVRDMALLKVNLQNFAPFLKISKTLPRQGEAVIAIGNPRNYEGSVSNGIVAGIRDFENNTWVQFTAPISPGSSGGALVNLHGEIIGMPTKFRTDGQNLNFAVAPTVLNQFLSSALNKTARSFSKSVKPVPAPLPKKPQIPQSPNGDYNIKGVKFLRRDDEYEMYLYTDRIDYDQNTQNAAFITLWWPTEKAKAKMRADPYFNVPEGTDLGVCVLLYVANFRDNKYLHLRTINYCIDGSVARDYIKPDNEFVWRTPKKGSRPDTLMREVKKQLRIR